MVIDKDTKSILMQADNKDHGRTLSLEDRSRFSETIEFINSQARLQNPEATLETIP